MLSFNFARCQWTLHVGHIDKWCLQCRWPRSHSILRKHCYETWLLLCNFTMTFTHICFLWAEMVQLLGKLFCQDHGDMRNFTSYRIYWEIPCDVTFTCTFKKEIYTLYMQFFKISFQVKHSYCFILYECISYLNFTCEI